MRKAIRSIPFIFFALLFLAPPNADAGATIPGLSGTSFSLTVKEGHISTADGGSVYAWGYAESGAPDMQYPGPTLIVNQGDVVTITLKNELPPAIGNNVSMVFPGHRAAASGGAAGLITREAPPDGVTTVTYTFTAGNAGTYLYHSGTRPELQVELGLVGAIIVRPTGYNPATPKAYAHADTSYDHEYLFLLTEMDPRIHELVEIQGIAALDATDYLSNYFPMLWFINGRNAPDTMLMDAQWLPTQPYNCMPRMHPGEKLLMRVIGAGRELHPYHQHANHARIIARDGRVPESTPGAGPDIGIDVFTIQSVPGETVDAIFEWTGKGLGWDIYGTGPGREHSCTDTNGDGLDETTKEYCPDHNKPFPTLLPDNLDMVFGGFYSGSPFLGVLGALPPGEGGLNPNAGFVYMWHSHTEKEMTNFDIFPGGMMTMLIVEPPGVPIP